MLTFTNYVYRFISRNSAIAARRFLDKAIEQEHLDVVRVINTDKAKACPKAMEELKESGLLPESVEHRAVKYLNNLIEQDHHYTKVLQ